MRARLMLTLVHLVVPKVLILWRKDACYADLEPSSVYLVVLVVFLVSFWARTTMDDLLLYGHTLGNIINIAA